MQFVVPRRATEDSGERSGPPPAHWGHGGPHAPVVDRTTRPPHAPTSGGCVGLSTPTPSETISCRSVSSAFVAVGERRPSGDQALVVELAEDGEAEFDRRTRLFPLEPAADGDCPPAGDDLVEFVAPVRQRPVLLLNRLGVKWFERLRLSSSRKSKISVRPRGTRPVPPVARPERRPTADHALSRTVVHHVGCEQRDQRVRLARVDVVVVRPHRRCV